jgi:hypothetical protein
VRPLYSRSSACRQPTREPTWSTKESSAVAEHLGADDRLDLVANIAGVYPPSTLDDFTEELYRKIFDVNVLGVLNVTAEAVPRMGEGSSVVNFASVDAFEVSPGQLLYGASKAAVVMLTKELALELAPQRIRVNAIAPGWWTHLAIARPGGWPLPPRRFRWGASERRKKSHDRFCGSPVPTRDSSPASRSSSPAGTFCGKPRRPGAARRHGDHQLRAREPLAGGAFPAALPLLAPLVGVGSVAWCWLSNRWRCLGSVTTLRGSGRVNSGDSFEDRGQALAAADAHSLAQSPNDSQSFLIGQRRWNLPSASSMARARSDGSPSELLHFDRFVVTDDRIAAHRCRTRHSEQARC